MCLNVALSTCPVWLNYKSKQGGVLIAYRISAISSHDFYNFHSCWREVTIPDMQEWGVGGGGGGGGAR